MSGLDIGIVDTPKGKPLSRSQFPLHIALGSSVLKAIQCTVKISIAPLKLP